MLAIRAVNNCSDAAMSHFRKTTTRARKQTWSRLSVKEQRKGTIEKNSAEVKEQIRKKRSEGLLPTHILEDEASSRK